MIPELNKIYLGDCLEVMRTWPSGFIDLIVTSPPYNLGNAKKGSFYAGRSKGGKIEYEDHDDSMDEDQYIEWQHSIIKELIRLRKPDGAIFYNHKPRVMDGAFDSRRNLIPTEVRQEIIWDRCCMVNFSGSFFAPQTERIFIIAGDGWRPGKEYLGWGDIWRIPPEKDNPHPAPFPLVLAKRIVESSSQRRGVVYDPFMGSGTTALASFSLGRNYIGTELTQAYIEMAEKRIADESKQGSLF